MQAPNVFPPHARPSTPEKLVKVVLEHLVMFKLKSHHQLFLADKTYLGKFELVCV